MTCHVPLGILWLGDWGAGADVLDELERVGTDSGKTTVEVTIADCGELSQ